ncbi:hypothetical protein CcaverHIS641_0601430 [Cutaneotrichosporon cavernicola]|nr:hypothetical protein CcaverHIS641_0601430 [Cutaneotrichosporon cavernicola]
MTTRMASESCSSTAAANPFEVVERIRRHTSEKSLFYSDVYRRINSGNYRLTDAIDDASFLSDMDKASGRFVLAEIVAIEGRMHVVECAYRWARGAGIVDVLNGPDPDEMRDAALAPLIRNQRSFDRLFVNVQALLCDIDAVEGQVRTLGFLLEILEII